MAVNIVIPTAKMTIGSHSLMFSGNFKLPQEWKIGGSSGYDLLRTKGFTP